MSFHHIPQFNIWAVLVSGLLFWVLGAVWFSPVLFAKPWMAALGVVLGGDKKGFIPAMISSLIGDLITALVMMHFIVWSGASSVGTGAFIGFLCWLGFFVAIQFPQGLYERRPMVVFFIDAGYWFVGLLGVGALLAVWH
jgi:hypothetical protein